MIDKLVDKVCEKLKSRPDLFNRNKLTKYEGSSEILSYKNLNITRFNSEIYLDFNGKTLDLSRTQQQKLWKAFNDYCFYQASNKNDVELMLDELTRLAEL